MVPIQLLNGATRSCLEPCHSPLSTVVTVTLRLFARGNVSSKDESIATRTIAGQNAYNLSLVKQFTFLESRLKTNCTALILNGIDSASSSLRVKKKTINSSDRCLMLKEAGLHQSVSLASEINWLQVWEAVRDKGPQSGTKVHFGQRFQFRK